MPTVDLFSTPKKRGATDLQAGALASACSNEPEAKKPPKCVQALKEQIGEEGKQITPDYLKSLLSKADYNNFCNNFRSQLTPTQKVEYKAAPKADQDKWIAQWAMDPAGCVLNGYQRTEAYTDNSIREEDRWMTEEQLAGPRGLNSASHAKILTSSSELPERPCRYACLAKAGVKEFKVTEEMYNRITGIKKTIGAEGVAELKDSEFNSVVASLESNSSDMNKQVAKAKATPKAPDPKKKELAMQNTKLGTSLRALKRKMDAVALDMETLKGLLGNLLPKGYPVTMKEFFEGIIGEVFEQISKAKGCYATHVTAPEEASHDNIAKVADAIKEVEDETASLTKIKADFEKSHGADMRKLTAK